MNRWSFLTSPPVRAHPAFVHGVLAVLVLLLGGNVWLAWSLTGAAPALRYRGLIVPLLLLGNHLAYYFRWPARVTVVLRLLSMAGSVLGLVYFLYVLASFA